MSTPAEASAAQLFAEATSPGSEQVAYRGRKRWTWSYAPVRAGVDPGVPAVLKDRGVYVITGGLGGLGLELAEQLARLVRARVVLLGRNGLPDRDTWDELLSQVGHDDPIARRVRGVQAIEAAGGQVLVCAADITDEARLRAARAEAEATFGKVDGVFHLAAVAGGGMLEARPRAAAEAVLRPKIEGTYVLEDVFRPDLFVLYSSIAVMAGDFGLGDYAGANAVLDAFAQTRWGQGRHVVAINWPAWNEVGMAVEIQGPSVLRDIAFGPATPVAHPLLRSRRDFGSDVVAFDVEVDPDLWVLAEHRMAGNRSVPGTGIVELIRAAHEEITGSPNVEIRDLAFPTLLTAKPGTEARAEFRQTPDGGLTFTLTGGHPSRPAEHFARGRVYPADTATAQHHDLEALRGGSWQDNTPPFMAKWGPIEFGRRWDTIRSRRSSGDLDVLDLRLPDEFAADTEVFGVHPALFDVAGAVGMTRPFDAMHIPVGYDRIVVRGRVPAACHSLIRHLDDGLGDLIRLDVTIVGADGAELVAAEGYSLLRVGDDWTPSAADATTAGRSGSATRPSAAADPMSALMREANAESSLTSEEGGEALRIVLANALGPQVIVCPGGVAERVRLASLLTRSAITERLNNAQGGAAATRSVATAYVAPETDTELAIAELWRDAIGVDQIGIDDEFVDLGGDSLLAVQLVGRISKRLKSDVSVAQLFEHRTVRILAASLAKS
jgi:NAD(P)-dependent dehydrogenase (short-subunit alcohol dehydrogenase family)/acyl carrier protein